MSLALHQLDLFASLASTVGVTASERQEYQTRARGVVEVLDHSLPRMLLAVLQSVKDPVAIIWGYLEILSENAPAFDIRKACKQIMVEEGTVDQRRTNEQNRLVFHQQRLYQDEQNRLEFARTYRQHLSPGPTFE